MKLKLTEYINTFLENEKNSDGKEKVANKKSHSNLDPSKLGNDIDTSDLVNKADKEVNTSDLKRSIKPEKYDTEEETHDVDENIGDSENINSVEVYLAPLMIKKNEKTNDTINCYVSSFNDNVMDVNVSTKLVAKLFEPSKNAVYEIDGFNELSFDGYQLYIPKKEFKSGITYLFKTDSEGNVVDEAFELSDGLMFTNENVVDDLYQLCTNVIHELVPIQENWKQVYWLPLFICEDEYNNKSKSTIMIYDESREELIVPDYKLPIELLGYFDILSDSSYIGFGSAYKNKGKAFKAARLVPELYTSIVEMNDVPGMGNLRIRQNEDSKPKRLAAKFRKFLGRKEYKIKKEMTQDEKYELFMGEKPKKKGNGKK